MAWRATAAVMAGVLALAGAAWAAVEGPLADTAAKGANVAQVEAQGYVAEEYFLSGAADTYESVSMADGGVARDLVADMARRDFTRSRKATARPYATRLIVYRPRDLSRFSGEVVVETLHPQGGGIGSMSGQLSGFLMSQGHAWVGVQHPRSFADVKATDPARYGRLAFEDESQLWGMLRDTGRLLKSDEAGSPFKGLKARRLYLTGFSFTGVATAVFANYHHEQDRLANGGPIFDGYLPSGSSTFVKPLDVPVMRITTQGDFNSFEGWKNRNADSDARVGRMRLYEVPGASHVGAFVRFQPGAGAPAVRVRSNSGNASQAPAATCQSTYPAGSVGNDYPFPAVAAAAFENMFAWVRDGVAPPAGRLIELTPEHTTRLDANGNAMGGVRTPMLEAPVATYAVGHTPACELQGYSLPFDAAKLKSLHGTKAAYVAKVEAAANALVRQRYLRAADATAMIERARSIQAF